MSIARDSRAEKKLKLYLRTKYKFKQGCEYIDWQEDVLYPEIEKLKAGKGVLGLEAGTVFDIQVVDDPDPNQETHTEGVRHRPSGTAARKKSKAKSSRRRY